MTTLQEALPCPFFGKQHTLQVISGQELMGEDQEFWQHSESFGVVCDASTPDGKGGCGAMGGFKPTEDEAIEAWNTRTALAQQGEQQPVCHGCGIPAGDVHMSTCKSGKWPSRVSNGDTAAPAPVAQHGEPVLVVEKEPDYWSGGHFHEGSKPHIKPTKVWCLPIGTQLFTHPMPAQDVTELVEALEALIESTTGVDQVSVVNDARTALSKYKGAK